MARGCSYRLLWQPVSNVASGDFISGLHPSHPNPGMSVLRRAPERASITLCTAIEKPFQCT